MANHLMIMVDWYGPYSTLDEARRAAQDYDWPGIYLAIGRTGRQRKPQMQYVGLSEDLATRLTPRHHTLGPNALQPIKSPSLWLGEVVSSEPSGRKLKKTSVTLDFAEWLHAFFLELPLNDKKRYSVPPRAATVLNRWWTVGEKWRANRPHPDWPNLIDHPNLSDAPSRAVWFGSKQKVYWPPDYE